MPKSKTRSKYYRVTGILDRSFMDGLAKRIDEAIKEGIIPRACGGVLSAQGWLYGMLDLTVENAPTLDTILNILRDGADTETFIMGYKGSSATEYGTTSAARPGRTFKEVTKRATERSVPLYWIAMNYPLWSKTKQCLVGQIGLLLDGEPRPRLLSIFGPFPAAGLSRAEKLSVPNALHTGEMPHTTGISDCDSLGMAIACYYNELALTAPWNPGTRNVPPPALWNGDRLVMWWSSGAAFGTTAPLYGSYPAKVAERFYYAIAPSLKVYVFPDAPHLDVMHLFSGMIRRQDHVVRVDLVNRFPEASKEALKAGKPEVAHIYADDPGPEILADAHKLLEAVAARSEGPNRVVQRYHLIMADPPYSTDEAVGEYGMTALVDRVSVLEQAGHLLHEGGLILWLDIFNWQDKVPSNLRVLGHIVITRSTNHKMRLVSVFQRLG